MSSSALCRCCLARPPDKDLKSLYIRLGKSEVYGEMLKECFEIQFSLEGSDSGICDVCIARLRDAWDFKHQVLQCLAEFQLKLTEISEDKVELAKIKEEYSDAEDNGIYFLEPKEELSDFEDLKDKDKLAEILGLDDVPLKRRKKDRTAKKRLLLDKKSDRKSKKLGNKTTTIKVSLRALSEIEKLSVPNIRFISENQKHSNNVQNLLKYSNCTPFSNKTLSGIVCAYCKETYPTPEELRLHSQKHKKEELNFNKRLDKSNLSIKMDINDLKCTLCEQNFDIITNLKKHLTKDHDIKFYPDINDYIMEFKLTGGDLLNCALCHSTFETFKMLLQHMNGHYRNYICEVCDLGFINKHRLKNHQRTHEIGSFKCNFCEKVFKHMRIHNNDRRFKCGACGLAFVQKCSLKSHMLSNHGLTLAEYENAKSELNSPVHGV
ncbi:zinc finger protein weckle-like isoform X3 [Maniola jurtina]|uniref:zinc finger protein weckle-like isoform X3 n=1 Tax=Maniola jurtina TaxID=191418 RepID=UPI001E68E3E3|nr:zinc finger protein weckle-like isoform X3 [Maniola jurtina]